MYGPIRDSASRREGRVRALGVKVKRVRVKSVGVVSSQNSGAASRMEQMEVVSICLRRVERMCSSRQMRRNLGLAVAITCAYRPEVVWS
jgi:hypothetical protein